ncbi:MAG: hypothetical protein WAW33_02830 [Minisyncoccia bacterium]
MVSLTVDCAIPQFCEERAGRKSYVISFARKLVKMASGIYPVEKDVVCCFNAGAHLGFQVFQHCSSYGVIIKSCLICPKRTSSLTQQDWVIPYENLRQAIIDLGAQLYCSAINSSQMEIVDFATKLLGKSFAVEVYRFYKTPNGFSKVRYKVSPKSTYMQVILYVDCNFSLERDWYDLLQTITNIRLKYFKRKEVKCQV